MAGFSINFFQFGFYGIIGYIYNMKGMIFLILMLFYFFANAQDSLEVSIKKVLVFNRIEDLKTRNSTKLLDGEFYVYLNGSLLLKQTVSNGDLQVAFPVLKNSTYKVVLKGENCITNVVVDIESNKYNLKKTKRIGVGFVNPLKYLGTSLLTPKMVSNSANSATAVYLSNDDLNSYYKFEYTGFERRFILSSAALGKIKAGVTKIKAGVTNTVANTVKNTVGTVFTSEEKQQEKQEEVLEEQAKTKIKDSSTNTSSIKETMEKFLQPSEENNDESDKNGINKKEALLKKLGISTSTDKLLSMKNIETEEDLDKRQNDIKMKREELKKKMSNAHTAEDSLKLLEYEMSLDNVENTLALIKNELTNQKEISFLNNKLLHDQNQLIEIEESKKNMLYWGLGFAAFAIILVLFFLMNSIKLTKRVKKQVAQLREINEEIISQRDKIDEQKNLIIGQKQKVDDAYEGLEEAHKEITDSINYAERIQRSFLASDDLLNKNLNEYFVYFNPKEAVSGDFYWAGKLSNGNFAMVNADSTGHGVPGAIMSILNISSIEKAVEKNAVNPADIFNQTRKTIIERLKKDGSIDGGKDGMDASLISFNPDKSKMTYVAAQNPIWVIRNNENGVAELVEIKPEKMPIGKHDNDHIPFAGGEFDIQTGDDIYTLTDGFQDQFGGPKGKKFMIKNMREFVLSICHLPMKDQHQKIKETFANRKGDVEQVDDVCVIGVRI